MTKKEMKYSDEFGKNYKDRSKASLHAEISYRAKQISATIKEAREETPEIFENVYVKNAVEKLELYSGVSRVRKNTIPIGSSTRSKELLIRQARELKGFQKWDIYTPEGKRLLEKRAEDAFETFKDHMETKENIDINDDFTREDWNHMVEVFGAIGSDVMTKATSDDFVRLYLERSEETRDTFLDVYIEIKNYYEKVLKESPKDKQVNKKFLKEFKKRLKEKS